jgi:hypothetical protein
VSNTIPIIENGEEMLTITRLFKFSVLPLRKFLVDIMPNYLNLLAHSLGFFDALLCFVFVQQLPVVKHISAWTKGIILTLANTLVVELEIQEV